MEQYQHWHSIGKITLSLPLAVIEVSLLLCVDKHQEQKVCIFWKHLLNIYEDILIPAGDKLVSYISDSRYRIQSEENIFQNCTAWGEKESTFDSKSAFMVTLKLYS